ncbi:P-loop containing nucleoside triphosphate hydrolase protein [Russula dissimulans]|nr:P-loop containing nucleoside triphosphate hydrolase protein [Russula dissimulans]
MMPFGEVMKKQGTDLYMELHLFGVPAACPPASDIDGSEEDTSVLQFILSDKCTLDSEQEVVEVLESVGFNGDHQKSAIGSLSSGWKMKLALARAMLFKADILLLDEPTNHLDVVNIAWLENYLAGLKHCTSIIVSHDLSFLNNTITDVLHLNRFKLCHYRGNLEMFVKAVPAAKSYYTLKRLRTTSLSFQTHLSSRVSRPKKTAYDITLQVSLSSHVAILGPTSAPACLPLHLPPVPAPAACPHTCHLSPHLLPVPAPTTCLCACRLRLHLLPVPAPATCLHACHLSPRPPPASAPVQMMASVTAATQQRDGNRNSSSYSPAYLCVWDASLHLA